MTRDRCLKFAATPIVFPMIEGMPDDPRNRRVTLLLLYEERGRNYDRVEVGADLMDEIEAGG